MSKMKAVRMVNLNYNYDATRIEDEIFYLDGNSTLLSLQNGGGKSVFVQMLMAPFVHKRYRDTQERKFSGYFTTNRPTHIMVEWSLEGGAGNVLVGMMVRKNMNGKEEGMDELEIISYIHEYTMDNPYDVTSIPVIETIGKKKTIRGFSQCKQLFEQIRKERGIHFRTYDLTTYNGQRQYFEHLKEYKIYAKEWETIIRKVNLKESGLSELFKDSKNEAGLVEKWFLPTIENKLNQEQNRMEQFRLMMKQYIMQYKQNESKLGRKDTILAFQEDAVRLQEGAVKYRNLWETKGTLEEKTAYLIGLLDRKLEELAQITISYEEQQVEYDRQITRIRYEKASYELYGLLEQLEEITQKKEELRKQETAIQGIIANISKQLHIFECAQLYGDYKREELEVLRLENELELKKQNQEELLPERNNLGYNLRLHYEKQVIDAKERLQVISKELTQVAKEQEQIKEEVQEKKQEQMKLLKEETKISVTIKQFDDKETEFNQTYGVSLQRNVLGYYEEEALALKKHQEEKVFESLTHDLMKAKSQKEELEMEATKRERSLGEERELSGRVQEQKKNSKKQLEDYEAKIQECKKILQYVSLSPEYVFDTEYILTALNGKIHPLEEQKRLLQKQKETYEDELKQLSTGTLLELPEEVREFFDTYSIPYIYGMEYLKQQKESKETQERLLQANPVLPYSIILSEQELVRLQGLSIPFFTSYPIPIIKREQLLQKNSVGGPIQLFYSFNEQLLDEEALQGFIQKKQEDIAQVFQKIVRMDEELMLYRDKRSIIEHQGVNKAEYENDKNQFEEIEKLEKDNQEKIRTLTERMDHIRKKRSELDKKVRSGEENCRIQQQLLQKLDELMISYEEYKKARTYQELVVKKLTNVEEYLIKMEAKREELGDKRDQLNDQRRDEESKEQVWREKARIYSSYQEGIILKKEVVDIEARYEAITKTMLGEIHDIEESLGRARSRFVDVEERLNGKSTKYRLEETEFREVIYDRYKVEDLEHQLSIREDEAQRLQKQYVEFDKEYALQEAEYQRLMKELEINFGTSELVAKELLVKQDFSLRKKKIEEAKEEVSRKQKVTFQWEKHYSSQRTALEPYNHLQTKQQFSYEEELGEFARDNIFDLSQKEFQVFQGKILRRYSGLTRELIETENVLRNQIRDLQHMPRYIDDFFAKPLQSLYEMVSAPARLEEQIVINLQSFASQLRKLEVDIGFIMEEKKKLVELLLDYTLEIHKNFEEIDRNSSINLRGKNLKMLQLQLQDVTEQENILLVKLKDYVEELTTLSVKRLHQNENIEELIGTRITTKELYDTIIGINSVQIKLFKIEEQGERKITWSEVCKNSGGEGFLSAFVILSSLLSYMRREDTDLFSRKEEGKVLVMDNPFAQTNAPHLLQPLMELAKKSNTQLICLSGLGGESIYNCFDNIYVLNLITSALNHVKYVTSEQVKGDVKVYEITSSRVQVEDGEQMELMF